jgi:UDP-N-acetylmuramate dehydrogenase
MTQILYFEDFSLQKYNSLQLNPHARHVYFPLSAEALITCLNQTKDKKRILLGKGSNILLSKPYYDETYAFIITTMMDNLSQNREELIVEAGLSLQQLAWYAIEHAIKGYEFCEDIPGTIGGALIMNAGQFEYTIGPLVHWVDVYDLSTNTLEHIVPSPHFFTYRNSEFKPSHIIVRCGLKIEPGDEMESLEKVLSFKRERYRKQPRNYPNAGSVFKRPSRNGETYYVWKLFEALGLRGYRIGGAEISKKHPGFIVNINQASIDDVQALIDLCQSLVKKHYDLDLELEWKVIE